MTKTTKKLYFPVSLVVEGAMRLYFKQKLLGGAYRKTYEGGWLKWHALFPLDLSSFLGMKKRVWISAAILQFEEKRHSLKIAEHKARGTWIKEREKCAPILFKPLFFRGLLLITEFDSLLIKIASDMMNWKKGDPCRNCWNSLGGRLGERKWKWRIEILIFFGGMIIFVCHWKMVM